MKSPAKTSRGWQALVEVLLIFAVFCLHGAWPTPDLNETHYLPKAKHYWNPAWAAGDFFLETADAHQIFYWTFGWLTLWLPLPAVAWLGRTLAWMLLAWGWQRLSWAVVARPWFSILAAATFVGLNAHAAMTEEWVVGGVEAKSFAYALVFFALAQLVNERWGAAWVLLGLATAFHVLVGGWAMLATGIAWLAAGAARRPLRAILPPVAAGVILALPGVYAGWSLTRGIEPQIAAEANRIYVFERLPHHLSPSQFTPGLIPIHMLLAAVWLSFVAFVPAGRAGERSLRWFVGATLGIAWIGLVLAWLLRDDPEKLAAVMRYYWFRASDAFVPLGVAIALARTIAPLLESRRAVGQCCLAAAVLLVTIDGATQVRHLPFRVPWVHEQPAAPRGDKRVDHNNWVNVCAWIVRHTQPKDIVLTPRRSTTLKWYAGRPEVATWKDLPQDARSIREWWDRMNTLFATGDAAPPLRWRKSLSEVGPARLRELMDRYGAEYVIVQLRPDIEPLPVEPLYKNDSFAVYRRAQLALH